MFKDWIEDIFVKSVLILSFSNVTFWLTLILKDLLSTSEYIISNLFFLLMCRVLLLHVHFLLFTLSPRASNFNVSLANYAFSCRQIAGCDLPIRHLWLTNDIVYSNKDNIIEYLEEMCKIK